MYADMQGCSIHCIVNNSSNLLVLQIYQFIIQQHHFSISQTSVHDKPFSFSVCYISVQQIISYVFHKVNF